ncbi:hypothetical protein CEXT_650311 [Caerostris extrusa]|uniref:Uncharacterized protein n=1 Tax=Caerostris extrusa TaxID=172846 RepID=A0AAV4MZL6_CAEEX|nr:hypothetical protein CEXT_650311 [Caerostris extrusa]
MQEKLCENITNSLKTHVEKIFREQITIKIEGTTENETPSEQETAQTTQSKKAGQQLGRKSLTTDMNRGHKHQQC